MKIGAKRAKVEIVYVDYQSNTPRAVQATEKLITQDKVVLLVNTSLSSTYAPMVAESKRSCVPLYYAGGVCPSET